MNRLITYFFIALFFLGAPESSAQKSREQLEREKKANLEKINKAQQILNETRQKKTTSIGKLKAINNQISNQQKQLNLLSQDISMINKEINALESSKQELQKKLELLKKEYAEMLYIASKSNGQLNQLSFLLASRSFNDLVMRYKYLEQYTDNRKEQVEQINKITKKLEEDQQQLNSKRSEKEVVLTDKEKETQKLNSLKKEQAQTVNILASEEKKLRAEIAASKKAINRLDNLITSLVKKSNSSAASSTTTEAKNEAVVNTALSKSFQNNQRKLPWPVKSGFISDKFGVKNHPVLANVKIDNNGVDIQTPANASVYSVFDGVVLDISQIPGLGNVVAIQHGEYFTIYANLASVNVSINQNVKTGQAIGTAGKKDGEYVINFQVWKQYTKLNPEFWLARK